ncbi:MAG: hypothetical protein EA347_06910 [Thioalkalivibrio sp.]|nr:MAG: hypothetical protein EA347_06910 [Thioalkalivibrio sp.]
MAHPCHPEVAHPCHPEVAHPCRPLAACPCHPEVAHPCRPLAACPFHPRAVAYPCPAPGAAYPCRPRAMHQRHHRRSLERRQSLPRLPKTRWPEPGRFCVVSSVTPVHLVELLRPPCIRRARCMAG